MSNNLDGDVFYDYILDKELLEGVFLSAVPISFYKQCLPADTVNLALSSTAFQWLSKRYIYDFPD